MAKSTTQKSLAYLRAAGYRCAIVERWNAFAGIRQDLWTFIDLLAVGHGELLCVQVTDRTSVSKRVAKICSKTVQRTRKGIVSTVDNPANLAAFELLQVPGVLIQVHGWRPKESTRPLIVDVELADVVGPAGEGLPF